MLACVPWLGYAQTSVTGRVFDGATGQALPFVNVSFNGTAIGTMTHVDGTYALDAGDFRVTRATYSTLGYQSQTICSEARGAAGHQRRPGGTQRGPGGGHRSARQKGGQPRQTPDATGGRSQERQ